MRAYLEELLKLAEANGVNGTVAGAPAEGASSDVADEPPADPRMEAASGAFQVGRKVRLVPWHGCTTCNLYPELHLVEGEGVLETWPIEAAGCRL